MGGERGKKMRLIDADKLMKMIPTEEYNARIAITYAPTESAEPKWIPITARPMDEEERIEWSEKLGYDIANDDGEALIFTSQLPDDGQEVLVCGRNGRVWIDIFMSDPDYGCYFEDNGDMDGIVAWMPLPKPYREKEEEDATETGG